MSHSGKVVMTVETEESDVHHENKDNPNLKLQKENRKTLIPTMLVVSEKHMQDANWVYYPFKKNSHGVHSLSTTDSTCTSARVV